MANNHGTSGNDVIDGTNSNDYLLGGDGNDEIHGGAGNDTIGGQNGDDVLYGDLGDDTFYDTLGNNAIYGGQGNDTVYSGTGDDNVYGNDGNDRISDSGGKNNLFGDEGDDIIYSKAGQDYILGGDGNDYISSGAGTDVVGGNEGNDTIYAGDGDDAIWDTLGDNYLDGGSGNDMIFTGFGSDTILGGAGADNIRFDLNDIIVSGDVLADSTGDKQEDIFTLIDSTTKTSLQPYVIKNFEVDYDVLDLSKLQISSMDDVHISYNGNIANFSIDSRTGMLEFSIKMIGTELTENNIILPYVAAVEEYTNVGGTLSFEHATDGVIVDLQIGYAKIGDEIIEIDNLDDISTLIGSDYGDIFVAGSNPVTIYGSNGDDLLRGFTADDTIYGGAGDDIIAPAKGNDIVVDTEGDNLIVGHLGEDDITFGLSNSKIYGDFFEFNGQDYKDIFRLAELKNFNATDDFIIGDFEVGLDVLDFSALGLDASDINITQNGYVSDFYIDNGVHQASFGIRTDGTKISFDNIMLTAGQAVNQNAYPNRDNILSGAAPSATLNGGAGFDTADYYISPQGVNINLETGAMSGGHAVNDTLISIENIVGSNGYDDIITGNEFNNRIEGWGGNDILAGGAGSDHVHGGRGNDIITDILGYNDMSGGLGEDTLYFSASSHRIYGGNYGSTGDSERDRFVLASWHENTDEILEKGDVIGDFEVGIDILDLSDLGIQATQISLGLYQNGQMIQIDTGVNQLNIGIRTHGEAMTMADIVTV